MGSDKCLLEIDGVACIQRVVMTLAEAGLEPIRISVASPEHMEKYGRVLDSSLQIEWVVDSSPYAGPIEAILDALLGASLGRHFHGFCVDFGKQNGTKLASNWSSASILHRKVFS